MSRGRLAEQVLLIGAIIQKYESRAPSARGLFRIVINHTRGTTSARKRMFFVAKE